MNCCNVRATDKKRLGRLSYSGGLLYSYKVEVGQLGANVRGDKHGLHYVGKRLVFSGPLCREVTVI